MTMTANPLKTQRVLRHDFWAPGVARQRWGSLVVKFFSSCSSSNPTKEGKSDMSKKLWSLSGLSSETGKNFRTVARALEGVRADGRAKDGKPVWRMATALAALDEHTRKTGRVQHRPAPDRFDPQTEAWCSEIETTGAAVDALLKQLRAEQSVEHRRALIEGGAGKCIGGYGRALEVTVTGPDAFLRRAFVDQQMSHVLAEIASLCEWRVVPQ
jgi:hypothetical protein